MKKSIVALTCALLSIIVLAGCECGHKNVSQATCTSGAVCKDCGETMGEAVGHQFESATCTKPERCSVCNEARGAALGHNYSDATCTESSSCTVCGKKTLNGSALGHSVEEWNITKESTCTDYGERTGACTRCNEALTEKTAKTEHTPGEWEITSQATPSKSGTKTKYCIDCGKIVFEMSYDLVLTTYEAGVHKVGTDIPAGEYVILVTSGTSGYFAVCSDANCDNIIFNDNFEYNSIVTVKNGEYIELKRCVAIPVEEFYAWQTIPTNISGVMLLVGKDIPAGEYKLKAEDGVRGYYCIYSSSRQQNIVSNKNFENSAYVSVKAGQYLVLSRCVIQK